ncbi:hypothetical protein [Streptomyces sp. NPDC048606]|uniref:hypothetical protein n=1 Tax=Streptomyces sp. NPDC048606 TaxID=3154726 RepID=UPI00343BBD31
MMRRLTRKILSATVATIVPLGALTALCVTAAGAAQGAQRAPGAVPAASCAVSGGSQGRIGLSGSGFYPGEKIFVLYAGPQGERTAAVVDAHENGTFEVAGLPKDHSYSLHSVYRGDYRRTPCPKAVSDGDPALS